MAGPRNRRIDRERTRSRHARPDYIVKPSIGHIVTPQSAATSRLVKGRSGRASASTSRPLQRFTSSRVTQKIVANSSRPEASRRALPRHRRRREGRPLLALKNAQPKVPSAHGFTRSRRRIAKAVSETGTSTASRRRPGGPPLPRRSSATKSLPYSGARSTRPIGGVSSRSRFDWL